MDLLDRHLFMELNHIRAFVVIRSSKEEGKELNHCGVQLGNVAYILKEEVVDAFVGEHKLIELCHHLLELIMSSKFLKQGRHKIN